MIQNKGSLYRYIRCLWAIAHKGNISSDELRRQVAEIYPKSEGHLSRLQIDEIKHLVRLFREKVQVRGYGRQRRNEFRGFASPAQTEFALDLARAIIKLKCERGEYDNTADGPIKTPEDLDCEAWRILHQLARQRGLVAFDYATTRDAAFIIEALKAIKKRVLTKQKI